MAAFFGAALAAGFAALAFEVAALVALAFAFVDPLFVDGFAAAFAAVPPLGAAFAAVPPLDTAFVGAAAVAVVVAFAASALSEREVRVSAARALPAAVWAPLALSALPAAMRALAAFWAWARLTVFAMAPAVTCVPPAMALIVRTRRDLRRAAAFGWIAPTFAARSRALIASAIAVAVSAPSPFALAAVTRADLTRVFAAERRGCRISCRRAELRTRFRPEGERAPVHVRGVLAKVEPLLDRDGCLDMGASAGWAPGADADGSRGPGHDRLGSMVAILGGLGAAASWAFATLASSRSSRMIGAVSVIGWVMLVGLTASVGPALLTVPPDLQPGTILALIVAGFSYNAGLLLTYAALTVGRVSIVAPITATEGALAAVAAVALGEPLAGSTALILAAIAVGVILAAYERAVDDEAEAVLAEEVGSGPHATNPRRAVVLAIAAAASFSVGLVVAGRLGEAGIPATWVVMVPRAVGVVGITLPLLAVRRLRLARPAAPLVVFSGLLEALGSGLYVIAAKDGLALAAVLGSQFAAIAAIGGFVFFGERLQRVQVLGVLIIALGVAVLAATQA